MTKHSKEPWFIQEAETQSGEPILMIISDDNDFIICQKVFGELVEFQRIVDCVNACHGINPEVISDVITHAQRLLECVAHIKEIPASRIRKLNDALWKIRGQTLAKKDQS